MKKVNFIFFIGILSISCVSPPRFQRNDPPADVKDTPLPTKVDTRPSPVKGDTIITPAKANTMLSKRYLDLYKSNDRELKRIQIYLGVPLVLVDKINALKKNINEEHGIELHRTEQSDTLIFHADLPGVIKRFYEESSFLLNKTTKVEVSFDSTSQEVLVFQPDDKGIFRLKSEPGKLRYGARIYDCIKGCSDNYLLVNAATLRDTKETRKYIPGWRLK